LLINYPSKIASMLLNDSIDVGLIPVAIIPEMKEHYIISDYCIGSNGEVASVCLFSEVPLEKIEKILLDYQSRTSVELLKILVKDYWKIRVVFEETSGEFQSKISGTTAALVIGDRALLQRKISPFIYDLGFEWKKYTGFPFVFAAWVSNKKLNEKFIEAFNEANAFGINDLDIVVKENRNDIFDLIKYYTRYISFDLNEEKKSGMNFFMKKIKAPDYVAT
ncbi:MAG: menaquinone biosynthetic enzyme MqnA/MqnD family protein, partial [Ginsengibacter sp.]